MEKEENGAYFRSCPDGVTLALAVVPRARKTEIVGVQENLLKVRVAAPPVEGAANKECVKFFSKLFGVSKSRVKIVQGEKSRKKVVLIQGISESVARERLNPMKS